jgi:hypothetical protein
MMEAASFSESWCTCVWLYGVILRRTAICNDDCGDKREGGDGDGTGMM